jgi:tRNA threonylcarbamoyladenosine biosynthesis protein TsaB
MRLLAIETSGSLGGVALAEATSPGGPLRGVEEVRLTEGLRHARDLILTMKSACDRAGWAARKLDVLALSIGPGSFTGLRVAVTAAKFVAWDTGARIVAVPSLRAMVENVPASCPRAAVLLDAKRGGLFASVFQRRHAPPGPDDLTLLDEFDEPLGPVMIEPAELVRRLETMPAAGFAAPPPALFLGPGVTKASEAIAGFDVAPCDAWDIRPSVIARLGYELHLLGRHADPLRLEPLYLRPPEAQEVWDKRHPPAAP